MNDLESVLILQGGGSLGAYECGVFKTLNENDLEFDIISGTSVGAVNSLIIAGSSNPAETLENFWHELSERISLFMPDETRPLYSTYLASIYGNKNLFYPKSMYSNLFYDFFMSPHLYSVEPLKKTLPNYVDFKKVNNNSTRVIITAVDIQNSKPIIFDSKNSDLNIQSVLATVAFPFYGIEWAKVNDRYLWDGSLLSNTPLREAISASPQKDKRVYLVSLFPRIHNELPQNMMESWHRARDIMHSDKAQHNLDMSKIISRHLSLLKKMHSILERSKLTDELKKEFESIQSEFEKVAKQRGAIIEKIIRIERREESHFLLEDADFSEKTIKNLIKQGQDDAKKVLKNQN